MTHKVHKIDDLKLNFIISKYQQAVQNIFITKNFFLKA